MDKVFIGRVEIKELNWGKVTKLGIPPDDVINKLMPKAEQGKWCNIEIKKSKGGKWYAELSQWEPRQQETPYDDDDNPPF